MFHLSSEKREGLTQLITSATARVYLGAKCATDWCENMALRNTSLQSSTINTEEVAA